MLIKYSVCLSDVYVKMYYIIIFSKICIYYNILDQIKNFSKHTGKFIPKMCLITVY